MRAVASFIVTSLDGFYEGPNGEFDWLVPDEEFNDFAVRQLDEADTLGFGRATYEHMAAYWPTEQARVNDPAITSRMNAKPKLVFSTSLGDAGWSNTTIIAGEAAEQIETVKAAPGGEVLVLGSAHLTAHFAAAGVLDELRIMVCPIVIGQGRSLFEDLSGRLALSLAHLRAIRFRQRPPHLPAVALSTVGVGWQLLADRLGTLTVGRCSSLLQGCVVAEHGFVCGERDALGARSVPIEIPVAGQAGEPQIARGDESESGNRPLAADLICVEQLDGD